MEASPLAIDGVLYNVQPWNVVTAYDAKTGRVLWSYDPEVPLRFGRMACCDIVSRGLAAWRGKIYVDYLRNDRGATSIAPYSPRARAGAPVSAPLRWAELARLSDPQAYDLTTIVTRLAALKSDPWRDLPRTRQSLTATRTPARDFGSPAK